MIKLTVTNHRPYSFELNIGSHQRQLSGKQRQTTHRFILFNKLSFN
ncbi:hypothetical protein LOT_1734 [Lentilactobacillus otakiensis DSM 19908 = JCM 15040]|uniref:Uncharacterized protein n=1 Tax=Lentilactobacillus otakiensis DSM 19908 = JCM 15040 TaxID=1423780 RepID=S4NMW9_9LACO|nr:hypothetical protein LOT_1734 [Lentilactobacillus otakiensis DSM 19908 = JCM 15040]